MRAWPSCATSTSSCNAVAADPSHKAAAWRRWLGIVLRTAHLAGVAWLGAALAGAPIQGSLPAWFVVGTGVALLSVEVADARIDLRELAGATSLAKLVVVAWMALDAVIAPVLFWFVLVLSALSSHAPRWLRHWRPGRIQK